MKYFDYELHKFLEKHCGKVVFGFIVLVFGLLLYASHLNEVAREEKEAKEQAMYESITRIESLSEETLDKVNLLNANFEELIDTEEKQ